MNSNSTLTNEKPTIRQCVVAWSKAVVKIAVNVLSVIKLFRK